MCLKGEAHATADGGDQALKVGVLEGRAFAAVVTDRMVMVLAGGVGDLEAGDALHLHSMDEAEAGQDLQGAVDAGEPYSAIATAELVVDLVGAGQTRLGGQQVEHLRPRPA